MSAKSWLALIFCSIVMGVGGMSAVQKMTASATETTQETPVTKFSPKPYTIPPYTPQQNSASRVQRTYSPPRQRTTTRPPRPKPQPKQRVLRTKYVYGSKERVGSGLLPNEEPTYGRNPGAIAPAYPPQSSATCPRGWWAISGSGSVGLSWGGYGPSIGGSEPTGKRTWTVYWNPGYKAALVYTMVVCQTYS